MLSSLATSTQTSTSSTYENSPSWWKFSFPTSSYATLAATLIPSSTASNSNDKCSNESHLCES